ncbi:MAG: hypothetical protein JO100_03820 [Pseudonocardia sp.]|nr:hypothetical protein [Pseudonocardia sp.]
MLEGHDGDAVVDTHSLLLLLAGLIDDELLGWSRELAAVGEFDHALELITAAVAAERVRLPEEAHAALLRANARRGQLGRTGVELPVPDPTPAMPHRFLADPSAVGFPPSIAAGFPGDALNTLPARLMRGCRLWLTWRLTPAGGAPGPVPHPVLLIEAADGSGADLLAYQVGDLLMQAGVFVSVEVFTADARLGNYHQAALDAARMLQLDSSADPRVAQDWVPQAPMVRRRGPGPSGSPFDDGDGSDQAGGVTAAGSAGPRAPLRPVDRVIAARAAARGQIGPGSTGDGGTVTPFERPVTDNEPERQAKADLFEPDNASPERAANDRGNPPADASKPARDQPPTRDPRWLPSRDQRNRPPDELGGPPSPSRRNNGMFSPAVDWQPSSPDRPGPAVSDQPASGAEQRGPSRPPADRRGAAAERSATPDRRPVRPGSESGGPSSGGPGSGPSAPGGPNGPTSNGSTNGIGSDQQGSEWTVVAKPVPPANPQPPGPPPRRTPPRPADAADLPAELSEVEQRLLRELQEELAAREDNGLPPADQPPSQIFRKSNGGGGRRPGPPPPRPMGPPPDHAG